MTGTTGMIIFDVAVDFPAAFYFFGFGTNNASFSHLLIVPNFRFRELSIFLDDHFYPEKNSRGSDDYNSWYE
jgi:hypothetical protein